MVVMQFIMLGIFQVPKRQADILFYFLYAVSATLAVEYSGTTLGKYLGKLKVLDADGTKPPLLYVGLRELTKSMYFIPYIGWLFGLISLFLIIFGKSKRGLHDYVGHTKIAFVWQKDGCENE
jgi:uncharacterized RDD family membrane protein YckC